MKYNIEPIPQLGEHSIVAAFVDYYRITHKVVMDMFVPLTAMQNLYGDKVTILTGGEAYRSTPARHNIVWIRSISEMHTYYISDVDLFNERMIEHKLMN